VRWRLTAPGAGLARWRVASRTLSPRGSSGWTVRAQGAGTATVASVDLPAGRTSELRVTVADTAGTTVTATAGRAVVPLDDRAGAVRLRRWSPRVGATAWRRTLSRGRAGDRGSTTLAAGHPVLVLGAGGPARIELRAGRVGQIVTAGRATTTRTITATRAVPAGPVALRVVSGVVDLDGVAVAP
jgi:hypothetical protein